MTKEEFIERWRFETCGPGSTFTRDVDALLATEREKCAQIAADEPNLPGPMPGEVREAVVKAIGNGKLEEVCRIFSDGMRQSILKKIRAGGSVSERA